MQSIGFKIAVGRGEDEAAVAFTVIPVFDGVDSDPIRMALDADVARRVAGELLAVAAQADPRGHERITGALSEHIALALLPAEHMVQC